MSHTITISDSLYARLEAAARQRGLNSIEQLLEVLPITEDEIRLRQEVVAQIDRLREQLLATYGPMPDSVELIRDDRAR